MWHDSVERPMKGRGVSMWVLAGALGLSTALVGCGGGDGQESPAAVDCRAHIAAPSEGDPTPGEGDYDRHRHQQSVSGDYDRQRHQQQGSGELDCSASSN